MPNLKPMIARIPAEEIGGNEVWDAALDWDAAGTLPVIAGFHENMTQTFIDDHGARYKIDDWGALIEREDPLPGRQNSRPKHYGPMASIGTEATEESAASSSSAGIPPRTIVSSVGYELASKSAAPDPMHAEAAYPGQSVAEYRMTLDIEPTSATPSPTLLHQCFAQPSKNLNGQLIRSGLSPMSAVEITTMFADNLRLLTDDDATTFSDGYARLGPTNAMSSDSGDGSTNFENVCI